MNPEVIEFDPCAVPRLDLDLSYWSVTDFSAIPSEPEEVLDKRMVDFPISVDVIRSHEAIARRNALELAQHLGYSLDVLHWPTVQWSHILKVS